MDHDDAAPLLSELARGTLAPAVATGVADHALACPECRPALAAMREVQALAERREAGMLEPHPESELLTRFALEADALAPAARAHVEAHVGQCPACAAEVRLARAAVAGAGWRGALAAWTGVGNPGIEGWLRPALTALAIVALVPAYFGLVEYPRAISERDRGPRHAQQQPAPAAAPAPAPTFEGGAAHVLLLRGPTRSAARALPRVVLAAGQDALPVVVDHPLGLPPEAPVAIRVLRANGSLAWSTSSTARALWDSSLGAATLLVPTRALAHGRYALEIAPAAGGPIRFSARFEVAPADRARAQAP